jgi:uncharacterized membrane protein YdjX (TVP38/TMEM64 family)
MDLFKKLLSDRRVRIAMACSAGLGLIGLFLAWRAGYTLEDLKVAWDATKDYLAVNPWILFLALVILPGLPVPLSALLVIAGLVWGKQPVMACSLCLVALALNLTWTYWLAAGPARKLVEKLLATSAITIPDLPRGDHLKLILVLKLTPGVPMFFQNYLLGFLRAPFRLYLPVAMLCNGIVGTGIVLSSVGIGDGKMMPALTGISLIAVGVVLTQFVRGWLARRKKVVVEG